MVSKTKTSTILIKFKVRIKGEEGKNYKTLSWSDLPRIGCQIDFVRPHKGGLSIPYPINFGQNIPYPFILVIRIPITPVTMMTSLSVKCSGTW